jgi:hypothetical protein
MAAPAATEEELPATVDECSMHGKELLRAGELDSAIAHLCKALTLSVAEHGELAECCAVHYVNYAEALYLQAKAEGGVFGGAVQKVDDDEDVDEEDDTDEGTPHALTLPFAPLIVERSRVLACGGALCGAARHGMWSPET